jgi:hypothetical protein
LGRNIATRFAALGKAGKDENIAAVKRAADRAEGDLFKNLKASMESHQTTVRKWLLHPNGKAFRTLVIGQDEITQSSRTAAQIAAMKTHLDAHDKRHLGDLGNEFLFQSARYFSALRIPTSAVRFPIKDGGAVKGPVHPGSSSDRPAVKIEGSGSASSDAHRERSAYLNEMCEEALVRSPARAIVIAGVAAGKYTLDVFAAPSEASNVHGTSFGPNPWDNRERIKEMLNDLASMAAVTQGMTLSTQSLTSPVRSHIGSVVSPIRGPGLAPGTPMRSSTPLSKSVATPRKSPGGAAATNQQAFSNVHKGPTTRSKTKKQKSNEDR